MLPHQLYRRIEIRLRNHEVANPVVQFTLGAAVDADREEPCKWLFRQMRIIKDDDISWIDPGTAVEVRPVVHDADPRAS